MRTRRQPIKAIPPAHHNRKQDPLTTSTVDPTSAPTFIELGADPLIAEALSADGITHAFPIQQQCMAMALEGNDIIGQAKTGTGKTLGFGIPLLQRLDAPGTPGYDALGASRAFASSPSTAAAHTNRRSTH